MIRRGDIRGLRRFAGRSAVPMFVLSMLFLLCIAVLVVLWVDVPALSDSLATPNSTTSAAGSAAAAVAGDIRSGVAAAAVPPTTRRIEQLVLLCIACIWPLVVLESLFHLGTRPWNAAMRRYHLFSLAFCVCPPLRMFARSPEMGHRLWLPKLGWRKGDRGLQCRLQRAFSIPMIVIALMILPVLITEYFLKAQVDQYAWLRVLLQIGTGVIWFAFAAEFILMVSVAEKKWAYVRANWLDLAIILLPVVSFLRSLRIIRVTRLAQLARAQQLTKMARVYRLRGTAMKAFRALVVLEAFHRLTGSKPHRRLARLRSELREKQHEVARLQREIARIEASSAADAATPGGRGAVTSGASDRLPKAIGQAAESPAS